MNDKIQSAIDTIAAQCEENRTVLDSLGTIESELGLIQDKIRALFINVVKSNPADIHFTTIARTCTIVGINIEEQKRMEEDVNAL